MRLKVENTLWEIQEVEVTDGYFYITASWLDKYKKVTASDQTITYAFLRLIENIQELINNEN